MPSSRSSHPMHPIRAHLAHQGSRLTSQTPKCIARGSGIKISHWEASGSERWVREPLSNPQKCSRDLYGLLCVNLSKEAHSFPPGGKQSGLAEGSGLAPSVTRPTKTQRHRLRK